MRIGKSFLKQFEKEKATLKTSFRFLFYYFFVKNRNKHWKKYERLTNSGKIIRLVFPVRKCQKMSENAQPYQSSNSFNKKEKNLGNAQLLERHGQKVLHPSFQLFCALWATKDPLLGLFWSFRLRLWSKCALLLFWHWCIETYCYFTSTKPGWKQLNSKQKEQSCKIAWNKGET